MKTEDDPLDSTPAPSSVRTMAAARHVEKTVPPMFELGVADGVVRAVRAVVNPDKLGHIGPVSDVAQLPEK